LSYEIVIGFSTLSEDISGSHLEAIIVNHRVEVEQVVTCVAILVPHPIANSTA